MKKIVLCGGGTAGHILPSLALLPELKKYFDKIVYIGSENGMEKELVKKENLPFYSVNSIKFDRTKLLSNLKIPFVLPNCVTECKKLLIELKPDIVFSKGGYVSLPVTLAAKSLNIPYVIHESDYSMGLANKLVAKHATLIMTNFQNTSTLKNCIRTGIPLRESIFSKKSKDSILKKFYLPDRKTILVTGGSLGAVKLNNTIAKCLNNLTKTYNVIHLTGKNNESNLYFPCYVQIPFYDNMGDLYKISDIVISRAGATTLGELEALNKKSIIIPLSSNVSRGDQIKNAEEYAKKDGFIVIPDDELDENRLMIAISKLSTINYKKTNESVLPNKKIVALLYDLTNTIVK